MGFVGRWADGDGEDAAEAERRDLGAASPLGLTISCLRRDRVEGRSLDSWLKDCGLKHQELGLAKLDFGGMNTHEATC